MDENVTQPPPPMKPFVRRVIGLVFAVGLAAAIFHAIRSDDLGLSRNVREAVAGELGKDVSALTTGDCATVTKLSLTDYERPYLSLPAWLDSLQRYVPDKTRTITDDDLKNLDKLPALLVLSLPRTQVTDAGLVHLAKLPALEWLNLY